MWEALETLPTQGSIVLGFITASSGTWTTATAYDVTMELNLPFLSVQRPHGRRLWPAITGCLLINVPGLRSPRI